MHTPSPGAVLPAMAHVGRADADAVGEADDAGDVEDNDARAGGFAGGAETAGTAVVEIGHHDHFAAAPSEAIHAAALGARECGDLGLR